ncbi:uncharacterized protein K452DRAFT_233502 [Aplosporella prunicola CBS 121167]|uniref:Sulfatase N-terminal domain-containing protein n=1 Tax=Aplosporella prunicola CBS 121167 TaxID=1176127 RepID=A0A6A6B3V7_9PEZI|nr:uncharacterized protein K452DRAFT_233502 [Aplosporella prunicola CBS 121167]KAF2138899.1 hypothetical protein K452DRAFT_233502 [Aplosporella prunicola CBS 121167]
MAAPNIIFIMADDHAAKAISAYGAGLNQTRNLDRLAADGLRFNHCYVTNSICTPSRAAILTGTHNHVNGVRTLASAIDNRLPNVAKALRASGYQTAMVGKWHLGEGQAHEPTGFDYWSVVPGQGVYFDPVFLEKGGKTETVPGYATDVITAKSLDWIKRRDQEKPFFLMCHHKAPHRSWECAPRHREMYQEDVRLPDTFTDDYKHRAMAAKVAKMRVAEDLTYGDLGLAQPEGGADEVGELLFSGLTERKIPAPATDEAVQGMRALVDRETGETFKFGTTAQLAEFKFQRYIKRYIRTIQAIDDSVGEILDFLDADPDLAKNTLVMYTSDQGFFLGEHGWFDKRFMYEESFQMPLLARWPGVIPPSSISDAIVSNVDFAPTFLDLAGAVVPSYMQGFSIKDVLASGGKEPAGWQQVAYHRYWMHNDEIHGAYAHYGVRDRRWKIIYWYNEGLGIEGTGEGGQPPEWELFDCEEDPLELFNVYGEEGYKDVVERMKGLLEEKMAEIGDEPVH